MKRKAPFTMGETGHNVARNIRTLRGMRKLSRRALAELCQKRRPEFSEGAVYSIERGERRVDVDDLVMFCDVFDVDITTMLSRLSDCTGCHGMPVPGFTCNTCGVSSAC